MVFEVENLLLMSHCVSGKYAVGGPHASVLTRIEPELLLRTSDGGVASMSWPEPDLMKVGHTLHRVPAYTSW